MSTDLQERFQGVIDGKTVVSVYRAFAEDNKPYCINVFLPEVNLYATFQPTEPFEDLSAERAEAMDRENAASWAKVLTELAEKAQRWDDLMDALEEADEVIDAADTPYQVAALDDNCTDRWWVDVDGDVYKYVDGQWWVTEHVGSVSFVRVAPNEQHLLNTYGPYTAVPTPGVQP
ncbi:hypothetical protein SEA_BRICOLE_49 [Mycobacterium phage Bricole]|uniref:Uncharacterized protein n=1 Tax=Mycobacterium phage Bricole TaxID=1718601 RepID=A0A0M4S405_9CAUD|nr:hypothetical protein SEA_BRICOLE_49 [Mycobacterium phage Bricole]